MNSDGDVTATWHLEGATQSTVDGGVLVDVYSDCARNGINSVHFLIVAYDYMRTTQARLSWAPSSRGGCLREAVSKSPFE